MLPSSVVKPKEEVNPLSKSFEDDNEMLVSDPSALAPFLSSAAKSLEADCQICSKFPLTFVSA